MLVGPPAYLPISPSYLLTEVGLGVLGIETAAICTSNFAQVQQANEDLSELGRRGPPQNGDQWGSLTSKCVRLEGPTYLDLPPSNMGQVPKKVLSKEAPLTRHFSDKDWQGKAAGRNQQSFLPLKTLSFQGLASKPT